MSSKTQPHTNINVDELLDDLKSTKKLGEFLPSIAAAPTIQPNVEEEDLNKWIIKQASLLTQQGLDVSEVIKQTIASGASPDEIDSYSNLMKAVATAMETLNKINLQNKKDKASKELKRIENEIPKSPSGDVNIGTVVVASREEMMDRLFEQASQRKTKTIKAESVD